MKPANAETIGILLMAYGSPDSLADVEAYFTDIRGGRSPAPQAVKELQARYEAIGGCSPLLEITRRQAAALEAKLHEGDGSFKVFVGMRHWRPRITQAIEAIGQAGIRRALGMALAPHYSRMSVGAYIEAARDAQAKLEIEITIDFIESWHAHPLFLRAVAERVEQALRRFPAAAQQKLPVVFTAHSLPERILCWNDPYPQQLQETSRGVAQMLGLRNWHFAYQSAGHTSEPWLGPDILDLLRELCRQDAREVLIAPIGFVSDHLEILYDIDVECQALARELGLHVERIESQNDSPAFIEALAAVVRERL
jgi:ferrochelatase